MAASTVLTSVSNWSEWHSDLRNAANANGIWQCIRRNDRVPWLQRPSIDAAEETWRRYQRQLDSDRAVRDWIMNHVSPGIRSFINSVGHYELSYVYDRLVERLNITPERLSLEGQRKRANSLMSRTTIPGSRNRESAMTDIALSDIETSLALRKPQTKRVTKKRALSCGICGTPHHDIYGCFYIHKHLRPEWFKPNIEISEHIVAELRKPNSDIVNLVKRAKNQKKEKKEYEDPADVSEELLLRQY